MLLARISLASERLHRLALSCMPGPGPPVPPSFAPFQNEQKIATGLETDRNGAQKVRIYHRFFPQSNVVQIDKTQHGGSVLSHGCHPSLLFPFDTPHYSSSECSRCAKQKQKHHYADEGTSPRGQRYSSARNAALYHTNQLQISHFRLCLE